MCGGARALPSEETESGAMEHMTAPEPSRAGRQDPEPWDA
jgi:hypothetical protein